MTDRTERLNADFYDQDSSTYDSRFATTSGKADHLRLMALLDEQLRGMDLGNVVEVGVGTGRVTRLIAALNPKSLRCVDISTEMLKVTEASLAAGAAEFLLGSAYELPCEDGSADSVVSVNLLSHLEDLPTFWSEVRRVLRPNGQALVTSTNLTSLFYPFGARANRTQKAFGQDVPSAWHRRKDLEKTAENAGLQIADSDGHLYVPRSVDGRPVVDSLLRTGATAFAVLPQLLRSHTGPMTILRVSRQG